MITALALSRAFDSGNYAAAYVTEDYERALHECCSERSDAYRAAFTLGFFASYERHEVPESHRDAYDAALASDAGKRCIAAGYIDAPSEE